MGRVVQRTICPKCRENGGDSRGDNLHLYDDGGYHCFACGYHRGSKFYNPVKEDYHHGSTVLPSDFSKDVPAVAWKWLLQYGLPMDYWRPHIGYSEKDSRLVFTAGDPVCFSIGRYIENGNGSASLRRRGEPSLERTPAKWFVWGDSHQTAVCYGEQDNGRKVVIVEDIISAHKVGRAEIAVPIFGTVVHPCHYNLLKHIGLPIVLWLDQDQGPYIRKKAAQISIYTGLPVEIVSTRKDPKEIPVETIRELLT